MTKPEPVTSAPSAPKAKFLSVRCGDELKTVLLRRANAAGLSLSSWILHELIESCREELGVDDRPAE